MTYVKSLAISAAALAVVGGAAAGLAPGVAPAGLPSVQLAIRWRAATAGPAAARAGTHAEPADL